MTGAVAGPTWNLDVELPTWLAVPQQPYDSAQWRSDVTSLFGLLRDIDEATPASHRPLSERASFDSEAALDGLQELAADLPRGHRLVAGLAVADRWPLPVVVRVTLTSDDSDDLLEAAGARGGAPVEAPIVDYLPDELGDGIVVTRFDVDDHGDLWASVCCARRQDGVDTVLTWRTVDLPVVPVFRPLLVSLLESVRVAGVPA